MDDSAFHYSPNKIRPRRIEKNETESRETGEIIIWNPAN